ncbi:glycosyltransferase [Streptomyces sp. NPDC059918]|uniref:UDP-N-acetylglucosamine--N-acetylmuramyl- (pentapeptide) pyrophosphoryl-undecaprenol N-acetylglucosamine transferase n=1 Tax=unclassified Streptomyces TaxID=2593676 RepID=UPI00364FFF29
MSTSPTAPRPFRLLVTGGGTGGHTYPALTAIRALDHRLAAEGRALSTLWIGSADGLEARVAPAEGIAFKAVATGKVRRCANPFKLLSAANVRDMARVPLGVVQARSALAGFRPDAVLATGGYAAVPAGLAARLCRRPLVLHEQTVRLGLANRKLARSAAWIAVSSDASVRLLPVEVRARAVVTGNPVRPEVLAGDADAAVRALGLSGFDRRLPTVYVTGGAQGAQQINEVVRDALPWLLTRANVVHQCGPAHTDGLRAAAAGLDPELGGRYHTVGFLGAQLPDVLALADVVVSRSGAGTVAEVTALGKPAVFVPLTTSADDEQVHNAQHLADAGAALTLTGEVTAERLEAALEPLLTEPSLRARMAGRARTYGRSDAADRLVDVILAAAAG